MVIQTLKYYAAIEKNIVDLNVHHFMGLYILSVLKNTYVQICVYIFHIMKMSNKKKLSSKLGTLNQVILRNSGNSC